MLNEYLSRLIETIETQTNTIAELEQVVLVLTEKIMAIEGRLDLLNKRHEGHIHNVKTGVTSVPTAYEK
jgi:hypothetical protein